MGTKLAKGVWMNVYRDHNPEDYDGSNGGTSGKHDKIFVLLEPGILPPSVKVELVYEIYETAPGYKAVKPVYGPTFAERTVGPMASGNYAMANYMPGELAKYNEKFYPIHDRYETPEEYDMLST